MSEVTNNELMVTEEGFEESFELAEFDETSNGNLGKKLVVLGVAAGAVCGLAYVCKDKINAFRDKRMEKRAAKRGYVMYKADDVEVVEAADLVDEIEETE